MILEINLVQLVEVIVVLLVTTAIVTKLILPVLQKLRGGKR